MKYSRKNKRVKKTRSKTHKRYMRGGDSPRTMNSHKKNPNPRSAKAKK